MELVERIKGLPTKLICWSKTKWFLRNKDYDRIYFYHIRKTGGTSINRAFVELAGDYNEIHKELIKHKEHRVIRGSKVYVNWNLDLINRGRYFYAHSHKPFHVIKLKPNTFTFTCLRDPMKRVISHYKMMLEYKQRNKIHKFLETESDWFGDTLDEFVEKAPKKHVLRQLFMFSKDFNVDEAVENISNLSYFFFLEDFGNGMKELSEKLQLDLKPRHSRKSKPKTNPKIINKNKIREYLEPEYEMIKKLKSLQK